MTGEQSATRPRAREAKIVGLWKRFGFVVVATMAMVAVFRFTSGLKRLLYPDHRFDGGDLVMRWNEVHAWFRGLPVYGEIRTAVYPPGSYPIFWPFVGWTGIDAARWIWGLTTLVLLGWLGWLLARESRVTDRAMKACVFLTPFVGYAAYSTIVNGQVPVLGATSLVAGILLLTRRRTWGSDLVGASLVVVSLIKPTLTVPVVWVAMIKPKRIQPLLLIAAVYLGLTLLASGFQPQGPIDLVRGWLSQQEEVDLARSSFTLQRLLALANASDLFLLSLLFTVVGTGYWVFRHRECDVWLLMGATAIVALLWTYHRPYDDLLLLLPLIALIRMATETSEGGTRLVAVTLSGTLFLSLLERPQLADDLPTWGLRFSEMSTVVHALDVLRAVLWLMVLGFLVWAAHRHRSERRPAQ